MKCYRCGEENEDFPIPVPSPSGYARGKCMQCGCEASYAWGSSTTLERISELEEERDALQSRYDAEKAEHTECAEELSETHETIETLRCELRRYEPSDGMMYKLLDMQTRLDDAAKLFDGILKAEGEHNAPWDDVDAWLERHRERIVPVGEPLEPHKTILALHTVIDEARRLFDKAWVLEDQQTAGTAKNEDIGQLWASVDEWRNRVLVQAARETVSGEVKRLEGVVNEVLYRASDAESHAAALAEDRKAMVQTCGQLEGAVKEAAGLLDSYCLRDEWTDSAKAWRESTTVQTAIAGGSHQLQYGLALATEQQKTRLLIGAVEEAARIVEVAISAMGFDAQRAEARAWLAHPTVTAARNEAKG